MRLLFSSFQEQHSLILFSHRQDETRTCTSKKRDPPSSSSLLNAQTHSNQQCQIQSCPSEVFKVAPKGLTITTTRSTSAPSPHSVRAPSLTRGPGVSLFCLTSCLFPLPHVVVVVCPGKVNLCPFLKSFFSLFFIHSRVY